ncbi:MAG: 50S ribosomal protein L24 [Planctomycetes bacterium]|nr:50S ribosomal protein L24 [Planctomycetota bacterium]
MASKIRKGDTVEVIAGKDLGKRGEVLRVDPRRNKVLVQGVNRVYKHMRPSRQYPQGGRIQKEMPLAISNVMVVDPKTDAPTRVGFRINGDGVKERYAKVSGESLGLVSKAKKS